jgi:hypothetical protein
MNYKVDGRHYIIGSSNDSDTGVGTLLRWKGGDIESIAEDKEMGGWIVKTKSGLTENLYDLAILTINPEDLEDEDLQQITDFSPFLK